jgi:hypothetical protein
MHSHRTHWLFTLAISLSLGCTYADDGEEREIERQLERGMGAAWVSGPRLLDFAKPTTYSGLFVYGFETADFIPDGTSEHWWVWPSESSDVRARAEALLPGHRVSSERPNVQFRVQWIGAVTRPDTYDRLGLCTRAILVERVLQLEIAGSPHREPVAQ